MPFLHCVPGTEHLTLSPPSFLVVVPTSWGIVPLLDIPLRPTAASEGINSKTLYEHANLKNIWRRGWIDMLSFNHYHILYRGPFAPTSTDFHRVAWQR